MESIELARASGPTAARVAGRVRHRRRVEDAQRLSAARVRRREPQSPRRPRPGRAGRSVPPAGRRLCRVVRRVQRHVDPRAPQAHLADGGRPHLLGRGTGREGGPHRRSVRQAAVVEHRTRRRRRIAVVPWPHRQRPGTDRLGPHPRPEPSHRRVPPVGLDAEPAASVHQGRVRRHEPGARLEPGVRRVERRGGPLRGPRRADRPGAPLHGGVRHRHDECAATPRGRLLHQPRGPRVGLRGGPHPAGFVDRRLVRLLGAHGLDRRAHPGPRRRAHRVLPWHPQPDRLQGRPDGDGRGGARAL